MAQSRPIKKKQKGYQPYGDPLPVPVGSLTGFPSSAASWNYYYGLYQDSVVIVTDADQIASLWHNGYFGQLKSLNSSGEENEKEDSCKYKKRWKLLESDGLKDMSHLKKQDNADVKNVAEVSSECEVIDLQEESSSETMHAETTTDNCESNQSADSCVVENTGNEDRQATESNTPLNNTAEIDLDCRTVLTFESDQNASYFFGYNNDKICSGYLELSLEEAMFLSYALGCLVVKRAVTGRGNKSKGKMKEQTLTIDQMWSEFVNEDPRFVARYFVYHHYRTKGWVIKCGLKFGADYVLYPVGPPFYHAQYTVMIQCVWADNHQRDDSLSSREMSWINIAATERLTSHVNKTPLICYVLRPRSLGFNRLGNIICLRSLTIEEVIMSRFDPHSANEPDGIITVE